MNNAADLWNKLLDESPPGSALMGGAVIDTLFNKTPKDYDIFWSNQVEFSERPDNWVYMGAAGKPLQEILDEYNAGDVDELGFDIIDTIGNYNVHVPGQVIKVQLIGLNMPDPKQHFNSFDHSLTLGGYDASGMFIDKRVFKAHSTKTVELLNPKRKEKSMMRAMSKVAKLVGAEEALNWQYKGW